MASLGIQIFCCLCGFSLRWGLLCETVLVKYFEQLGAGEILLTSMDKDGTKSGYDIDLLKTIRVEKSTSGG